MKLKNLLIGVSIATLLTTVSLANARDLNAHRISLLGLLVNKSSVPLLSRSDYVPPNLFQNIVLLPVPIQLGSSPANALSKQTNAGKGHEVLTSFRYFDPHHPTSSCEVRITQEPSARLHIESHSSGALGCHIVSGQVFNVSSTYILAITDVNKSQG